MALSFPVLQQRILAMIQDSFKNHKLSDADKRWLREVAIEGPFDPRIAKVKLHGSLPKDFDAKKIDERILFSGQVTPVGRWHLNQADPLFDSMDKVACAIREMILKQPGIALIKTSALAQQTGLSEDQVGRALYELGIVGHFYSNSSWGSNPKVFTEIQLSDETSYDEYLNYNGIDDVLDSFYRKSRPSQRLGEGGWLNYLGSSTDTSDTIVTRTYLPWTTKPIKSNTAFVLMAMDPGKPELVDVYSAIKDACREFDIKAYRADDIEHQERITDLILREIRTCEYLIADLTFERPNVYYEVGYAHAIEKKPILYRKVGTPLHFDLVVHNVPEYRNVTDLRELLRKRFEAILGRHPREKSSG